MIPDKIPYVGIGCIVERDGQLLLVRNRRGYWSTPGGHLDFGEAPEACAIRETFEETGISLRNVEFVAITNDVLSDVGKHYLTVWFRGNAEDSEAEIRDPEEIAEIGWFKPNALPRPLHLYFENLLAGRCLPPNPQNIPVAIEQR